MLPKTGRFGVEIGGKIRQANQQNPGANIVAGDGSLAEGNKYRVIATNDDQGNLTFVILDFTDKQVYSGKDGNETWNRFLNLEGIKVRGGNAQ
jgi:hypothetical protein